MKFSHGAMRESRIQTEAHRQFPIPRADARGFDTLSARVVALVDRLLQTAWKTERARMAFERKQAKRHVLTLDDELDELLTSWYYLADDEWRTVERAATSRDEVISRFSDSRLSPRGSACFLRRGPFPRERPAVLSPPVL